MKILIISILSLAAIVAPNEKTEEKAVITTSTNTPCPTKHQVFEPGEKMVYKVFYNWTALWLNAGEVVFKVQEKKLNNKDVYHLSATGQTYKSYEWFYKVKDVYESYVDINTLRPYRFARDVYEGGYVIKQNYDFDHEKQKVFTEDFIKSPGKKEAFDIPSCVHDVVSAIYYARSLDFDRYKVNDKIPLTIFVDGENYPMYIRYLGKETIKTKLGKFHTIKIKPLMLKNEYFEGGEKMTIWVTDDQNKIPVRIETPIRVGSIKADLMSYSGLKYNFNARAN